MARFLQRIHQLRAAGLADGSDAALRAVARVPPLPLSLIARGDVRARTSAAAIAARLRRDLPILTRAIDDSAEKELVQYVQDEIKKFRARDGGCRSGHTCSRMSQENNHEPPKNNTYQVTHGRKHKNNNDLAIPVHRMPLARHLDYDPDDLVIMSKLNLSRRAWASYRGRATFQTIDNSFEEITRKAVLSKQ